MTVIDPHRWTVITTDDGRIAIVHGLSERTIAYAPSVEIANAIIDSIELTLLVAVQAPHDSLRAITARDILERLGVR